MKRKDAEYDRWRAKNMGKLEMVVRWAEEMSIMLRRFAIVVAAGLMLAACTASPVIAPAGHVVGPDEAQAILYDATVTARAAATQSALATGTRVREQELLADDQTRTAAQAQAVSTQLAATPTAFSQMATATDYAFDRRAR